MAVDLRDAEQDGLTAEDFFGKDAKGMADAIIANSPVIGLGDLAKLAVLVGVILSFYRILQDFSSSLLLSLSPFVYLPYFIWQYWCVSDFPMPVPHGLQSADLDLVRSDRRYYGGLVCLGSILKKLAESCRACGPSCTVGWPAGFCRQPPLHALGSERPCLSLFLSILY